jgi:hypothetical protein
MIRFSAMIRFSLGLALITTSLGCSTPHHLQYDHGRSFADTMAIQADLSRPSVAQAIYSLSGEEALALSQNATESLTGGSDDPGLTINIGDASTD